jgi:threonylcarbamoyladenosine tRNA methylthiotransferase MtaB
MGAWGLKNKRIAIATLGCKINQYETDGLLAAFERWGAIAVAPQEYADIIILNACTVTSESDSKTRHLIRSLHRTHPDALLIVTGCVTEPSSFPANEESIPYYVVPNTKKALLPQIVHHYFVTGSFMGVNVTDTKDHSFDYQPGTASYHTRSYLKIQDGCDQYCTYCRIPFVRGMPRSRPLDNIVDTAQHMLDLGTREIILTGIHIGKYRWNDARLVDVLEQILNQSGIFRVRVSSIEINEVTPALLDYLNHPSFCPHLHLPLQSGSDAILKRMQRPYTQYEFRQTVDSIRQNRPDITLTTDVMVGFPGETDADLQHTLDTIMHCDFYHVHTFPYSKRPQTPAESYSHHIPSLIKKERSKQVRALSSRQHQRIRQSWEGKTVRVLFETKNNKSNQTVSQGYSDHWIRVSCNETTIQTGTFYSVRIIHTDENRSWGVVI